MGIFERLRQVRALHHLMPYRHAVQAAFGIGAPRTLRTRLRATGRPFSVRLGTSDLRVLKQIFARQEYALPMSLEPRTIIDAGANIGCATIFFANRYPNARIIAIEPDPSNFEMLLSNCAGLSNVTPVAGALWSHPTTLTFIDPQAGKWAFAMKERAAEGILVRGMTIAQLIAEFALDRIDVLKMDIEGGEKEVFSAADLSWLDLVGTIAIELHDFIKPGCAKAMYSALGHRQFEQRQRGDLIFITLVDNIRRHSLATPPREVLATGERDQSPTVQQIHEQ